MALYRLTEKSFINNTIYEEGAEVEYDGEPSDHMVLVKGKKGKAAAEEVIDPQADQK
ncbi:MAG: hypothetical protein PHP57_13435 [Sideroxydans sp.]|nr:hypothetical protein [Sideroxydans sp.]